MALETCMQFTCRVRNGMNEIHKRGNLMRHTVDDDGYGDNDRKGGEKGVKLIKSAFSSFCCVDEAHQRPLTPRAARQHRCVVAHGDRKRIRKVFASKCARPVFNLKLETNKNEILDRTPYHGNVQMFGNKVCAWSARVCRHVRSLELDDTLNANWLLSLFRHS